MRILPTNSVQIQAGLYIHEYRKTISGVDYTFRELYSAEGYCFYDTNQEENYEHNEESGERLGLKAENERVYYQYTGLAISLNTLSFYDLNKRFISVPIKEEYQIV